MRSATSSTSSRSMVATAHSEPSSAITSVRMRCLKASDEAHVYRKLSASLRAGVPEAGSWIMKLTACREPNGVSQCAGHVKNLLLEFAILIQLLMCGGVRLHVSDVAIKLGEASG